MAALPRFDRERFQLCLLFVAIAASACLMPAQTDTWWQLRTGEEMWRSGHIMLNDEFTHTVAGKRWPNHEWLSQIVFYATYSLGGLPLLTALCAAAVTLAWLIVSSLTRTPGAPIFRVALVGLGAMFSSPAWSLRPQVLTLAFLSATLWIVVRRHYVWTLPPLFLIWANLHGAVALGGLLIVAATVTAAVRREHFWTWCTIAVLCFLATAVTPLGPSLWFEIPGSLQRLQAYGVLEWQAPQIGRLSDLPFWLTAGVLAALGVRYRRILDSSASLTLTLCTSLLFLLALRSARHVPTFLICAIPTIAVLLPRSNSLRPQPAAVASRRRILDLPILTMCAAGSALFVATAWLQPLPRLAWTPISPAVVAAVDGCPGRLYNRYDDGGYLIWFMKHRPVFMDSRQDPFPAEMIMAHIDVERSGDYKVLFAAYDIGCSLSLEGSPLGHSLRRDGWREADAGGGWKVYHRPAPGEPLAMSAVRKADY
jgi:hypothetical protein